MNNISDELQNKNLVLLQKTNMLAKNSGFKVAAVRGFIVTGNKSFVDDYNKLDKVDDEITKELIDTAVSAQGKQFATEQKKYKKQSYRGFRCC